MYTCIAWSNKTNAVKQGIKVAKIISYLFHNSILSAFKCFLLVFLCGLLIFYFEFLLTFVTRVHSRVMFRFYMACQAVTVVTRVITNVTFVNLEFTLISFTWLQLLVFCQVLDFHMTVKFFGGP